MAKPNPDPIMSIERSRKQAKKRVNQLRKHNLEAGGENLSGPIDDLTATDLETLLAYHRQTNVKASKIGVVRWAIRFAAETLRKEGKL